jgi:cystathionine gamma-lyase
MAGLEYAQYGFAFSSGCAAMTCVCLTLQAGDHIICCDDVYGGTQRYIRQIATKNHRIEADFVDMTNPHNVEKAVKANTRIIWIETPTNPTLKVCDIKKICEIAKKLNLITVVDNTFATPYL